MRRLILTGVAGVFATVVVAQELSPVRMTVVPMSNRKASGSQPGALQPMGGQQAGAGRYLRVTILNLTTKPLTGVTVRWGILKSMPQHATTSTFGNMRTQTVPVIAFGGQETLDLNPRQEKIFETEFLDASVGKRSNSVFRSKEKIEGHGVEIYLGGKIVAQEYVGFRGAKYQMEELHPIEAASEDADSKLKSKIIPPPVALQTASAPRAFPVASQRPAAPVPATKKGIRFDGLYAVADEQEIKMFGGRSPYRHDTARKGRDYYRFYPDGTAIRVHVSAGPAGSALEEQSQSVGKWFGRGHRGAQQGRYTVSGARIEVAIRGTKLEGAIPEEDQVLKLGSMQLQFVYIANLP
jgi:hypothetical protein